MSSKKAVRNFVLDKIIVIIGWIITIIALYFFGKWVVSLFEPKVDNGAHNTNQQVQYEESSYSNPTEISDSDMAMTSSDFVDKYAGKWIKFNGTLGNTSGNYTTIHYGDNVFADSASFSDGSVFTISPSNLAFGDGLERFSSDYQLTTAELENPPKVTIIARVATGKSDKFQVYLIANPNTSGDTPSIIRR